MKLLAVFLAIAVQAGVLAACSTGGPGLPAVQVSADQGGTIAIAGARLSIPRGAVSGNGELHASTIGAPAHNAQPASAGHPALLSPASAAVHFTLAGTRLIRAARITFAVPRRVLPSRLAAAGQAYAVWLAFYDSAARRWQAVPSRYHPASDTVTAEVHHLSWWTAWSWDFPDIALSLRQALSQFGSGRAATTGCDDTVPLVTVTSVGQPDPPVVGCAARTGPGTLTASLTNNRGLSMVMRGVPSDAAPGPVSYTGLDAYLTDTALRQALAHLMGGAILPPGETITYVLPLHGPAAIFTADITVPSYLMDQTLTVGEDLFGGDQADYASCILDAILQSKVISGDDAPELTSRCLPVLARNSQTLEALGQDLGEKFSTVVKLLQFDVSSVMQDYDLAYDGFRGIRGKVQIDRPAAANATGPVPGKTTTPTPTQTQPSPTQPSPAQFAVISSSPTSGPASGGTLIVIHGSGFSSVNKVVMNSIEPPLPEGNPNYFLQVLHPRFSVISDSEIDVTTTAGAADFTYEIDFFTPTDEYFRNTFHGIPLFTYK
ncbi:MAG: IPT/TIG domain-containing protein [Streptosporangiaceae bacterium]